MSDIREASLEPATDRLPGAALQAGPFAILGAAALWLRAHYDELPARLPAHWNAHGDADRFVARTPEGVSMPLVIGAALCLMCLLIQAGIRYGSPRGAARFFATRILLAVEYFFAFLMCGILGAMVTAGRLLFPVFVLGIAGAIAIVVLAIALMRQGREPLRNPSGWRGGFFYVAPDDPALWVPKRYGYGYTLNWSHPAAVPMLIVILGVPLAILVWTLRLTAR